MSVLNKSLDLSGVLDEFDGVHGHTVDGEVFSWMRTAKEGS